MGIEKNIDIKTKMIGLLRNELPVLRAKARASQENMAEMIGISRQTYSSIETGKREMSWTTFLALIAYFQNNDSTKRMINGMKWLSEGMKTIIKPMGKSNDR